MRRGEDTLGRDAGGPSGRDVPETTIVPATEDLATLSGPRRALVVLLALLLVNSGLPWYHLAGRGFAVDLNGWHEIGTLAWLMALGLLVWELARLVGLVRLGGEGDRISGAGGLAVAFVGLLFVVRRVVDGDLGWAWMVGTVLLAALAAVSAVLYDAAGGREGVASRPRDGDASPTTGPQDPDAPRPGAPPVPAWRRAAGGGAAEPGPARPPDAADRGSTGRPSWRAGEQDGPSEGRPAWRAGSPPPAAEDRLAWRAVPDAPGVPAADAPVRPSGPGPAVAPEPPAAEAPDRVPPWRRGAGAGAPGPATVASEGRRRGRRRGSASPPAAPPQDVPPWRGGRVEPPPGGWPKTPAEKQRDGPRLW